MSECKECDGTGIAPITATLPAAPAPTDILASSTDTDAAHAEGRHTIVGTLPRKHGIAPITKEWCERMAKLEAEHDGNIEAGAAPAELAVELPPLPEGLHRLETVQYWAAEFAKDPQRLAGCMIVQLLKEYAELRAALAARQAKPECAMCNDSGIVGRAPDDYFDCPDCVAARQAPAEATAPAAWAAESNIGNGMRVITKLSATEAEIDRYVNAEQARLAGCDRVKVPLSRAARQVGAPDAVLDAWSDKPPTEQAWYWHWNGDSDSVPIPTSVLYSGSGLKCFVSMGQLGIGSAIMCDQYGGYWLRMREPDTAAIAQEKAS